MTVRFIRTCEPTPRLINVAHIELVQVEPPTQIGDDTYTAYAYNTTGRRWPIADGTDPATVLDNATYTLQPYITFTQ